MFFQRWRAQWVPRRQSDAIALYDKVAGHYERLHAVWLRIGGAQAIAAIEGCVAGELKPGVQVLDAGCGPGNVSRRLNEIEPRCRLTLLDAAPRMLACAADVPGDRRIGDVRDLPFGDVAFDIVVCTWVLEVLGRDRELALAELLRVLRPGGLLCYCVCSRPTSVFVRWWSVFNRIAIEQFFYGRFLWASEIITPKGGITHKLIFHSGLSTVVVHRKLADEARAPVDQR